MPPSERRCGAGGTNDARAETDHAADNASGSNDLDEAGLGSRTPESVMKVTERRASGWNGELLRRVFLHQNGLAAITALATLEASGILDRLSRERLSCAELVNDSPSPCAVAASIVAACDAGWLAMHDDRGVGSVVSLSTSSDGAFALDILLDAHRGIRGRDRGQPWSDQDTTERLLGCVDILTSAKASISRRTSLPDAAADLLLRLVEGLLAVPLLPRIARGHDRAALAPVFAALDMGTSEAGIRRVLSFFGPMYGLAGSYAKTLIRLPDRVAAGQTISPVDVTRQIDRGINVRASATAHRGYFHAATRLVARHFDQTSPAEQPRAILDIGCGDGSWLRELYEFICTSTSRGQSLREYPLVLLGVDMDPVALEISERNLSDLPAICLLGDVGRPAAVAQEVTSASGIDMDDIMSVRAFVDHNRSLGHMEPGEAGKVRITDGVYATPSGSIISADAVRQDWAAHYAQWRQACGRHGLVVIEAHTLDIATVRERLENSHTLALRYYHALSGQSPIPFEAFRGAASFAGFTSRRSVLYPETLPTTSINWLAASGNP
ncbi:class I SAM-dependent methyltransferase [Nonomuraea diastatica]|uniref:Class I SAM-dependent methyltransferase n=1 Tax=Nonomuraea diastatica TaxID=1848329 RepID=A0A4R4W7G2_9ACTN|nr:class I SAM-dependent methyltransferase [Nonomuraea diastatica]TDD11644.1 class I SAM-dependent methyltransferase [Nonomuraea diastatica]